MAEAEAEVAADTVAVAAADDKAAALAASLEESLAELELQEGKESSAELELQDDGDVGETMAAAEGFGERARRPRYPVRPGEMECAYYMKTGGCKFGWNCKFNHPPNRRSQETLIGKEKTNGMNQTDNSEQTESIQSMECKYYLTTGGCKYGKSCKFGHWKEKAKTEDSVELNFLGLPIRLGAKECQFYLKTGSCKFASNCRFHHPDPTAAGDLNQNGSTLPSQPPSQPPVAPWNMQMPMNQPLSPYMGQHPPYAPYVYPHHPVAPMNTEWNGYAAPEWNMPPQSPIPSLNMRGMGKKDDVSTAQQQQRSVDDFPERPGEPECQHYMKTGYCKFRSACRYHHPKNRSHNPICLLNPAGLPLRPGQIICSHFSRYGICKFGPACMFDHSIPDSSSTAPWTSSGSDGPSNQFLNSSDSVEYTPKERDGM